MLSPKIIICCKKSCWGKMQLKIFVEKATIWQILSAHVRFCCFIELLLFRSLCSSMFKFLYTKTSKFSEVKICRATSSNILVLQNVYYVNCYYGLYRHCCLFTVHNLFWTLWKYKLCTGKSENLDKPAHLSLITTFVFLQHM